jgi:hypothetical protein
LLDHQEIEVNQADKDGEMALHWAAQYGRHEIVKLLLAHPNIDVNKADKDGQTSLLVAAQDDKHEIVKLLIESGKCDLSLVDRNNNDIWRYYPADQGGEIVDLLMKHGAKYPQKEKNDKVLLKILESNQSAHSEGKTAQAAYNKFKESKEEPLLKKELEENADWLIKELNRSKDELSEENYIKIIKDLINYKYKDVNVGQGKNFIGFLVEFSMRQKMTPSKEDLLKAINGLNPEMKTQLINYTKKMISEGINHYTSLDSKPFYSLNATTKDFFGVLGAKIKEKLKEDIGDTYTILLQEILDAGTMYNSGGSSCPSGFVNKMFTSVHYLFDDNSEVKSEVKKGAFAFAGYQINYDKLLEVSMNLLKESGDIDILSKIAQGEFTAYVIQKIASKVYKILKETEQDQNEGWKFSEIVSMGLDHNVFVGNNEKINTFCKELEYKTLSQQTYGKLFSEGLLSTKNIPFPLQVKDHATTLIKLSEAEGNIALGNQEQMEIQENPYVENQDMIMTDKTLLGNQSDYSDSE